MGKFSFRLQRSRSQKLSSRQPGQPSFSYEHLENFMKERVVLRDLRNQASLVNRAHMKRSLVILLVVLPPCVVPEKLYVYNFVECVQSHLKLWKL